MRDYSRCREKVEGWLGRKRWYKCRECGRKFQVDTLGPLPISDRVCPLCRPWWTLKLQVIPIKEKEEPR